SDVCSSDLTEPQIAMPLIIDGEMINDNLAEANITEEWLLNELERQEYELHKVFFAEWLEGKKLYILPYTKIKKKDWKNKQKYLTLVDSFKNPFLLNSLLYLYQ